MQRILITGHSGMLGRRIVETFSMRSNKYALFGVSKSNNLASNAIEEFNADLTDDQSISRILSSVNPDIIVNTAALTNLQFCETHREEAYQLHVHLSRRLAEHRNARILYISTDSVFSGEGSVAFSETDSTHPLNYYAQTKLEGEIATLQGNPQALVLRTNIFGFKQPPGNSLAEWALRSFAGNKSITGYSDVFFNPLYVGQVAELLLLLLDTKVAGILHLGTSKSISKFEFLRKLAKTFGYSETLICESVSPSNDSLRRPKGTTLNIGLLNKTLNRNPSVSYGLKMLKSDILKSYENN